MNDGGVQRTRWAQARAVARLARRTARREWQRTTLVAALVAVPVMVAVVVAGLMRAADVTPAERITAEMGTADVRLMLHHNGDDEALAEEARSTITRLVAGSQPDAVVTYRQLWDSDVGLADVGSVRVTNLPLDTSVTEGMLELLRGRAPASLDEIALSSAAIDRAGLDVGDVVELAGIGSAEIVGEVVDPLQVHQATVVATGGGLDRLAEAAAAPTSAPTWLLAVDEPSRVAQRLREGYQDATGYSDVDTGMAERAVTAEQGPTAIPIDVSTRDMLRAEMAGSGGLGRVATPEVVGTLVAAVLLAEVALIAGAAYATGARRRLRELGLLGANGATTAHLRAAVVGEATVTGILGGLVGVVAGLAALVFGRPLAQRMISTVMSGVELSVADLLGPVVAAVAAVTIAAWLPARTAARVPTTTALEGRMPLSTPKRWIVPAGLALAVFGGVLFLVGVLAGGSLGGGVGAIGVLLAVGGTALLTVPIIALVGRFADRLPATLRLVVRDSARQRTRAAAASASALIVLLVPVLVATVSLSQQINEQVDGLRAPGNHVLLAPQERWDAMRGESPDPVLGQPRETSTSRTEMVTTIRDQLPDAAYATVSYLDALAHLEAAPGFQPANLDDLPREMRGPTGPSDGLWRHTPVQAHVALAAPELLEVLGLTDAMGDLDEGEALVLGTARRRTTVEIAEQTVSAVEVPTHVLRQGGFPRVLLPSGVAGDLGLSEAGTGDLFVVPSAIDSETRAALYSANDGGIDLVMAYNQPESSPLLRWIAVGAALLVALVILGLVTMLSATESDRDLRAMVAVGAAPRMRRRFLGLQSGVHALVGAVLGVPLALGLAWASLAASAYVRSGPFGTVSSGAIWWDWPVMLAVILGVPTVIAAVIALLVRSAPTVPPRRLG